MTTVQIVNTVLILILPALIALCYVFAQFQIQKMPVHQRAALEQFSRMAVRHVMTQPEQLDRQGMAKLYLIDLFKAFNLPVPPAEILDIAISAAMYEISR
jgi:hypothetical protein